MRRFLYFIPGVTGANERKLADCGLLDRFTDGTGTIEHQVGFCDEGPAGSGCMIAAGAAPPAYEPEHQEWMQGEQFWVGIEDVAQIPQADDLVRPLLVSGYKVDMVDKSTWIVPLIRRWDRNKSEHVPNVPTCFAPVIEGGKRRFQRNVEPRHRAIDDLAGRIFEGFCTEVTISIEQLMEDASKLLAVNYRVGVEEVGLLGLLDEYVGVTVLQMSIDYPTLQRVGIDMAMTGLQSAEIPQQQQ